MPYLTLFIFVYFTNQFAMSYQVAQKGNAWQTKRHVCYTLPDCVAICYCECAVYLPALAPRVISVVYLVSVKSY
jgi:hypothetical protein